MKYPPYYLFLPMFNSLSTKDKISSIGLLSQHDQKKQRQYLSWTFIQDEVKAFAKANKAKFYNYNVSKSLLKKYYLGERIGDESFLRIYYVYELYTKPKKANWDLTLQDTDWKLVPARITTKEMLGYVFCACLALSAIYGTFVLLALLLPQ